MILNKYSDEVRKSVYQSIEFDAIDARPARDVRESIPQLEDVVEEVEDHASSDPLLSRELDGRCRVADLVFSHFRRPLSLVKSKNDERE